MDIADPNLGKTVWYMDKAVWAQIFVPLLTVALNAMGVSFDVNLLATAAAGVVVSIVTLASKRKQAAVLTAQVQAHAAASAQAVQALQAAVAGAQK